MNKERINKLITALKTEAAAKMFDMGTWAYQPTGAKHPIIAFESGGSCGTSACIAGMAAIIDTEFFELRECPEENRHVYSIHSVENGSRDPFGDWLGIDEEDSYLITDPYSLVWREFTDCDIGHAIKVLEAFRDGGMSEVFKIEGVPAMAKLTL